MPRLEKVTRGAIQKVRSKVGKKETGVEIAKGFLFQQNFTTLPIFKDEGLHFPVFSALLLG